MQVLHQSQEVILLKGNPCKYTTYKQKSVDGKKYLENHSNGVAEYQQ